MTGWRLQQLTFGSAQGRAHAHSYYDIPVADGAGRRVLVHRLGFAGRHPGPGDAVALGWADADRPGTVTPLGESRAWSWQQGPMAQWVAGGPRAVWNDREGDALVARLVQVETGARRTLSRPVYAVSPDGRVALSLDMGRLDRLRPGYGYPQPGAGPGGRAPDAAGIWALPLEEGGGGDGAPRLILPLDRARRWLLERLPLAARMAHRIGRYHYWFNHAKIAPGGRRFTVKLRWRRPDGPWSEAQGVSLTAAMDGTDLRLLADATSHVIWQTDRLLYLWRRGEMALFEDAAPRGRRIGPIGAGAIGANVHLRHLPPGPAARPDAYVFDTPYAETVTLNLLDPGTGAVTRLAEFGNHRPARGPFRCDLHPCPSADGRRIFVTSPADGARQLYMLERAE
jgi:hypothetical protein